MTILRINSESKKDQQTTVAINKCYILICELLLFLMIAYAPFMQAQEVHIQQDFGAWVGFRLKKDLPKAFELSLEQQLRTWKNSTRIDKYFADVGLTYTINKNFRLSGNLRYIHNTNKRQQPENGGRYNIDFHFRIKPIKKIQLSYRGRYQQNISHSIGMVRPDISTTVRHKLKIQFKYKKKHKIYGSAELFVKSELLQFIYLDKVRYSIGDKFKIKKQQLDFGLGYEQTLKSVNPFSFFFIKVIYTLPI